MHFQSCKIDTQIALFLQGRNGKIFYFCYENRNLQLIDTFACWNLTYCRLAAHQGLLAFPSPDTENAIDLIDLQSRNFLLKSFTIPGNGMCMFARFHGNSLLIGFETGRLCQVNFRNEILFNEKVIEDSCNDAVFVNNSLFAVGASNKVACWQRSPAEVAFSGFSSIASLDSFIFTGGWDAK